MFLGSCYFQIAAFSSEGRKDLLNLISLLLQYSWFSVNCVAKRVRWRQKKIFSSSFSYAVLEWRLPFAFQVLLASASQLAVWTDSTHKVFVKEFCWFFMVRPHFLHELSALCFVFRLHPFCFAQVFIFPQKIRKFLIPHVKNPHSFIQGFNSKECTFVHALWVFEVLFHICPSHIQNKQGYVLYFKRLICAKVFLVCFLQEVFLEY